MAVSRSNSIIFIKQMTDEEIKALLKDKQYSFLIRESKMREGALSIECLDEKGEIKSFRMGLRDYNLDLDRIQWASSDISRINCIQWRDISKDQLPRRQMTTPESINKEEVILNFFNEALPNYFLSFLGAPEDFNINNCNSDQKNELALFLEEHLVLPSTKLCSEAYKKYNFLEFKSAIEKIKKEKPEEMEIELEEIEKKEIKKQLKLPFTLREMKIELEEIERKEIKKPLKLPFTLREMKIELEEIEKKEIVALQQLDWPFTLRDAVKNHEKFNPHLDMDGLYYDTEKQKIVWSYLTSDTDKEPLFLDNFCEVGDYICRKFSTRSDHDLILSVIFNRPDRNLDNRGSTTQIIGMVKDECVLYHVQHFRISSDPESGDNYDQVRATLTDPITDSEKGLAKSVKAMIYNDKLDFPLPHRQRFLCLNPDQLTSTLIENASRMSHGLDTVKGREKAMSTPFTPISRPTPSTSTPIEYECAPRMCHGLNTVKGRNKAMNTLFITPISSKKRAISKKEPSMPHRKAALCLQTQTLISLEEQARRKRQRQVLEKLFTRTSEEPRDEKPSQPGYHKS